MHNEFEIVKRIFVIGVWLWFFSESFPVLSCSSTNWDICALYIPDCIASNTGFISLLQCWNDGEPLWCASECLSVLFAILVYCVLMQDNCSEGGKNLTKYIFTHVSFFNINLKSAYIFLNLTLYRGHMNENRAMWELWMESVKICGIYIYFVRVVNMWN